jgi:hypothetical protein
MTHSEHAMTTGTDKHDDLRWHDNIIYALHLDAADPDRGVWRSDLVLDIDHIVEWICGTDGSYKFRVAPATLVFHDVADLRIAIDFGKSDFRGPLNELSIHAIARVPAPAQGTAGPFPYFLWRIELNLPQGGEIAFGASSFTQALRAEPDLRDEQRLPASARQHLMRRHDAKN